MPIIVTNPIPAMLVPPTVYRICGVSMHNVAEPTRTIATITYDDDGNPVAGTETQVLGYMLIEYEAGDEVDGAFVARGRGVATVAGDAFEAYLDNPTGAAIAALLKLYLHEAMQEVGAFPAGTNVLTEAESAAIASFVGRYLAQL